MSGFDAEFDDLFRESSGSARSKAHAGSTRRGEVPDRKATATPDDILASVGLFDAEGLMRREFAPLQYVVPGMIAEGFTILAGSPKVGKSWLLLDLAYQLSFGGRAFGSIPLGDPRPVLDLALEDGPRRLQARLRALGHLDAPQRLAFVTSPGRVEASAVARAFVERYADEYPVVILDTIGKGMPPARAGQTAYERDYQYGSLLKSITDDVPGSALIGVHHSRKAEASDFLDAVSGTKGLSGSADAVALLTRERFDDSGILAVTSRDADEGEYAMTWRAGRWHLDGSNLSAASAAAANRRTTDGLGDKSAALVAYVNAHPEGVSPLDAARAVGLDNKRASDYLARASQAGRIVKAGRGLYVPVESAESVETDLVPDPLTLFSVGSVEEDQ